MKIILVDNYGREEVADLLAAENITNNKVAEVMLAALRSYFSGSDFWPRLVDDDYTLSRRMEDLV